MSTQQPDPGEYAALRKRVVQAIADPGHFTPRGDESVATWSARAVEEVLAEWLADIERRVEESAAYARGKADGYAEHSRTFGSLIERGYEWDRLHSAVEHIAAIGDVPNIGPTCHLHREAVSIARDALASGRPTDG